MLYGILAGIFWALGTIILGLAMDESAFSSNAQAALLAPFVSTFLHDAFSALCAAAFNAARGRGSAFLSAVRSRGGRWIALGALLGGPAGMTGYILAIRYLGSGVGAVASAAFPAVGTAMACLFLREHVQWYRWFFLLLTLGSVYALSYAPDAGITDFRIGILGVLLCAFGWGAESVILAKGLRDPGLGTDCALQIRQSVSAILYAAVLLPALRAWRFTAGLFTPAHSKALLLLAAAALCSTASYLCYYRAIEKIGASRAMALDISYAAWAMVLTAAIRRDASMLNPVTLSATPAVLLFGILAATDFRAIAAKRRSGHSSSTESIFR